MGLESLGVWSWSPVLESGLGTRAWNPGLEFGLGVNPDLQSGLGVSLGFESVWACSLDLQSRIEVPTWESGAGTGSGSEVWSSDLES